MSKILRLVFLSVLLVLFLLPANTGLVQQLRHEHSWSANFPDQSKKQGLFVEIYGVGSGAKITKTGGDGSTQYFNVEGFVHSPDEPVVVRVGNMSVASLDYVDLTVNGTRVFDDIKLKGSEHRDYSIDIKPGGSLTVEINVGMYWETKAPEYVVRGRFGPKDSSPPSQDFSVELIPDWLSLEIGEEKQINAEITAPGIDSPSLVWESSNPSIVTVDDHGNIKAVGAGEATIRAFLQEKMGVSGSAVVQVIEMEMPSISITRKPAGNKIAIGEEFKLEATITNPNNYSNLGWDIVAGSSAEISRNSGVLKGIAPGYVTVRVYLYISEGKYIEDLVDIEIVEDYWIDLSPGKLTLEVGETGSIGAKVNWPFEKVQGVQYNEPNLYWEVLNPEIITINVTEGGKVAELEAQKEGNTTVVVSIEGNNSITAYADIEVAGEEIAINRVSFNPPCFLTGVGSSGIVRAFVEPADATEELLFRSRDMNIVATEKLDNSTVQLTGNLAYDTMVEAYVIRSGKTGQPDQEVILGKLPVAILPESGAIRIALFSAQGPLTALYQNYRDKGFYLKPGETLRLIGVFQNAEAHWNDKKVEWVSSNQDVIGITNEYAANPVFRDGNASNYCSRNHPPFNDLGNLHPVVVIQATENIGEISSASITVRSAGNHTDAITIWVVPASYEELWKELIKHSDQQTMEWFRRNRAANIPPPIKNLISSPFWKALDYHPKKWILNVFTELLMGNMASAFKEALVGNLGPAAQAVDHLIQQLLGEDYAERAKFGQHNPEFTPIDFSPVPHQQFPDSGELIQR